LDVDSWDALIAASPAESIYPYSWYLDAAAGHWSALVSGEYQFVMPLIWKRKYGIRYLYQPTFCQQLGVYGREYVDPLLLNDFVKEMMKRFRFGVVNFNAKNLLGEGAAMTVDDRSNYILSLERPYEELSGRYSTNAKRNLKRAQGQDDLDLDLEVGLGELMDFKKRTDLQPRSPAQYERYMGQFQAIRQHADAHIFGIRRRGELLAACFLARSQKRITYLLSISNEEGKEARAMFRIIDQAIRQWSASSYTFDFEGSNIPSIARFFGGFGASPEIYQSLSFNRFPLSFILGRKYGA
jgi:hypothetical protein